MKFNTRTELEEYCQANKNNFPDNLAMVHGKYLFALDPNDHNLTPHLKNDGYWEIWDFIAMQRILRDGMNCIDVGANQGYFTVLMADMVYPGGNVVAVEPNSVPLKYLRKTLYLNDLDNVFIVDRAASDLGNQKVVLKVPYHDSMNASHVRETWNCYDLTVKTATIDVIAKYNFYDGRVDLMKFDIEGAEWLAWKGSLETIRKNKDIIIFLEFAKDRYPDGGEQFLGEIMAEGFPLKIVNFDGNIEPITVDQLMNTVDWTMLYLMRES